MTSKAAIKRGSDGVISTKVIEVVAAVFSRRHQGESEVLVFERNTDTYGAGVWEFPGGKIEEGETHEVALKREIWEELSVEIQVGEVAGEVVHSYPQRDIHLFAYHCEASSFDFILSDHKAFKWVNEAEIAHVLLAPADRPLVAPIFQRLKAPV